MKTIILIIAFLATVSNGFAQEQIVGKWATSDGEATVEIYQEQSKFAGKIIWLKSPNDANGSPLTDMENPDKSKRNTPLIGLMMLKDFKYKNNKWEDGTIYDPEEGKTYKCSMWLEKGKLKVRGHWGMFYQTQTWVRRELAD